MLTSECGFGHVPLDITHAKLSRLVEASHHFRKKHAGWTGPELQSRYGGRKTSIGAPAGVARKACQLSRVSGSVSSGSGMS